MFKIKPLEEWKTSLVITLVGLALIILAYAYKPDLTNFIPDGWKLVATLLTIAFPVATFIMFINDIDKGPRIAVLLIAAAILTIELGYKTEGNADPVGTPHSVPEMERKP